MTEFPEERRIASLLRELIARSGTTMEVVESRLGWERGRLAAQLDGDLRLSFDDVLDILPLLGTTPTEFFATVYGFDVRNLGESPAPFALGGLQKQRAMDRLFERSLRAVRKAIARRAARKVERNEET